MSLEPGIQVGDYRILSRIGAGAYGEVFEAEHVITARHDALKVLVDGRLAEDEQRFLREIQVQASLQHANIAAVYNAFRTPYGLVLVMELVRGEPLSAILAPGGVPLERGIGFVLGMLEGLAYAHAQGVVHRDIKPENIIITPEGAVKLTDFGLARSAGSPRLTQTGAFGGSPCYMSPEQAIGTGVVDARSDTYYAGVVIYEVATGRLPFTDASPYMVMAAHQNSAPQPPIELEPAIGPELNQLILRALEKKVDDRFQTAGELHAALQEIMARRAASGASPQTAMVRSARPGLKRLRLAGATFSILAAGAFYAGVRHPKPAPAALVSMPQKPAPAAVETVSAAPVPVAPVPDPAADARPQPSQVKRPRRSVETGLRIYGGSSEDEPGPPVRSTVRATRPAESRVSSMPAPPAIPAPMPSPPQPSPQAVAEDPEPASAPPSDAAKAAPAKRRHVLVRAFQRVFKPHRDTNEAPDPNKHP